jgi:integrase/recombinase XerD
MPVDQQPDAEEVPPNSGNTSITWQSYPAAAAHPAAHAFLEALGKRQKAAKTLDAYARNLEDLLRTWPDAPPGRIVEADFADIEYYLERLVDERRLSDATIQQRLVTARLFFDFCLQRSLRRNPVNPVPRGSGRGAYPRHGLVPRRQRLPWLPTDAEWESLLEDLFTHEPLRNQALVLLAYDAALRRQELLGLRLDDLDWSLGIVQVRAECAKGGRARRVPISATTERLLSHYVQTVRAHLLAGFGGETTGPLFLSESPRNPGVPLRPGALNDIVDRLRARLDLPQLHPHTFRHLRCTILKRCGLDLDDIALFAGHASTSSTQLYVHLAPTELARRIRDATAGFDSRLIHLIAEHLDERPAVAPHP